MENSNSVFDKPLPGTIDLHTPQTITKQKRKRKEVNIDKTNDSENAMHEEKNPEWKLKEGTTTITTTTPTILYLKRVTELSL